MSSVQEVQALEADRLPMYLGGSLDMLSRIGTRGAWGVGRRDGCPTPFGAEAACSVPESVAAVDMGHQQLGSAAFNDRSGLQIHVARAGLKLYGLKGAEERQIEKDTVAERFNTYRLRCGSERRVQH